MIGLDTNVVVRYVTQDDPKQSPKATRLIESLTPEAPGYVSQVVVIELVWVLDSCYQASREDISRVLETLLRTKEIVVESAALIWKAVRAYRSGSADFADLLIALGAAEAGSEATLSFDRGAVKHAGMRLVE